MDKTENKMLKMAVIILVILQTWTLVYSNRIKDDYDSTSQRTERAIQKLDEKVELLECVNIKAR